MNRWSMMLLLTMCLGCGQALGQAVLLRGHHLPALPSPDQVVFFVDTTSHALYQSAGDRWTPKTYRPMDSLYVCGPVLVVCHGRGNSIREVYAKGGEDYWMEDYEWCGEKVAAFIYDQRHTIVFDSTGALQLRFGMPTCPNALGPMVVQGISAITLPGNFPGIELVRCEDLRNWGVLGSNGRWLIAPQYDKPILFREGRASVSRYKEKFEIDEFGNRLE